MKSKTKATSKPKNEWFFVDRLYRWLPIFLLLFSFSNVFFVIKYVNEDKKDFLEIRDRALLNASNSYMFVHTSLTNYMFQVRNSLSNELIRIKIQNDMRLRPMYSFSTNTLIHPESSFSSSAVPVTGRTITGRFFKVSGKPYVDIHGSYYSIGSDFGFGVVDSIFPIGVVCAGVFYPFETKREIVTNVIP